MEKPITKFFLTIICLSGIIWLYATSFKNYESGLLLKFGTVEFIEPLSPDIEREAYRSIADNSIIVFISYPVLILAGIGYTITTRRSFKRDGWLLMSSILFFGFVPVEIYCFWLDWKIVGLYYWGSWPLEEFRKALFARLTALAGLPFIALLCYYTIPVIVFMKPFKRSDPDSEKSAEV